MKRSKLYYGMMGIMTKLMLSCETAGILICQQQHEPLPWRKRVALKLHLMTCKLCERFSEDMSVVQSGINTYKTKSQDTCIHAHLEETQKQQIAHELDSQVNSE